MPKIVLVIPPSPFLLDQKVFPHLGVLKVAAALEHAGRSVEVLDLSGDPEPHVALRSYCRGNTPAVVGFTASTPQMPYVKKLVKVVRECAPKAKVVLGGPHATLAYASFGQRGQRLQDQLRNLMDVIVVGDGEHAIFQAVEESAPGVIPAPLLTNQELDELIPERSSINLSEYHYEIDGYNATSMIGQLGCPFRCRFCGGRASPCYNRIRNRSVQSILAEMVLLKQKGYQGIMFYDDELNVSKNFVPLLKGIIDLHMDFHLRGFIKAELFTEEQARLMYKAGFRWVLCGFESGSNKMLANMGKTASVGINTKALHLAQGAGLKVKALMSLGHPGESLGTVLESQLWVLSQKPDDFDVTLITPYPGSAYYDEARQCDELVWEYQSPETGEKLFMEDADFLEQPLYYKGDSTIKSHVWTENLTREELTRARTHMDSECRRTLCVTC